MALTDYGYADEITVQRIVNLLNGSTRLATKLGTVDTEFNTLWAASAVTTPTPASISGWQVDQRIGVGQVQVFVFTSTCVEQNPRNPTIPMSKVKAHILVALQAANAGLAYQYMRRYKAAIYKILCDPNNRGYDLATADGQRGIVGNGELSSDMRPQGQFGFLEITINNLSVQEYGN
jgi:hypothetical protein